MIKNKLNNEEINLIVESLLFSASADICSNWSEEENEKMVKIALKLKKYNKLSIKNIELIGTQKTYENKKLSKKIKNKFKIKTKK